MRLIGFLFSLTVLAVFAALAWQNAMPVQMSYPGGTFTLPLAVLCIGALMIGWLLGVASMLMPWFKQRLRAKKIERRCRLAEQEIANLREIPLKNGP